MKRLYPLFLSALIAACGKEKSTATNEQPLNNPAELGKELFHGTGNCFACHQPDKKIIAPSIKEIANIYKSKGGDMIAFLKGEAEPIVDPSQYETMKTNFAITKSMSDDELKALETYMFSFAQ